MSRDLVRTVRKTIRREQLLPRGATVVAGFSGGPDSCALLCVLLELTDELELRVVAAHLDHALREGSAADADFAAEQAALRDVRFVRERVDWTARGGFPLANVESRARVARYEFLRRVAAEQEAVVAVGHHADDRVETFLAQLLRGAGPRGLSRPRYRREDGVVRPLLDCTRAEILEYLASRHVAFRHDPTNEDGSNLRARLRRDVVPALRRENPEIARIVGRTASLLSGIEEVLEEQAREASKALVRAERPGELVLDGRAGRAYHRLVLSTILRNAVRGLSPAAEASFEPVDRLVRAWKAGRRHAVDLPGGVRVSVEDGWVVVAGRPASPSLPEREIPVPGSLPLDGFEAHLRVDELSPPPPGAAELSGDAVAWLDANEVRPPLRLRGRHPGDRYRPLGLSGSAKVQDLMVNRKIPRRLRDAVPLVVDGGGILWIPGFRVDARMRITDTTSKALRLTVSGRLPWLAEAREA